NTRQVAARAQALQAPQLAGEARFASNADRLLHRQALRSELSALLAGHDAPRLAEQLLRQGVPAAAVQTVEDVLNHPHTRHRDMVWDDGDYRGVGSPVKLSRTPASLRRPPPALGGHGAELRAPSESPIPRPSRRGSAPLP